MTQSISRHQSYVFSVMALTILIFLLASAELRAEKQESLETPFTEDQNNNEEDKISYAEQLKLEYEKKAEEIITQEIPEAKKIERIEALRDSYIKKLHSQVHR